MQHAIYNTIHRQRKIISNGLTGLALVLSLAACSSMDSKMGADTLADTLTSGDRADADKQRDAGRKPAEVIQFLGITEGMSVVDIIAASGYYTEVLSVAVGKTGTVYAQNPDFILKMREGANDKALTNRLAKDRLSNVVRLDRDLTDLGIKLGSLDAAFTALNLHDLYNRSPDTALGMLISIKALLKPGGVFGIIDHNGSADQDNASLHRMPLGQALSIATKAGFIVQTSDVLANPKDDRTKGVFTPGLRGNTDRFVLKLIKP
jgi:predicted methyltransferase